MIDLGPQWKEQTYVQNSHAIPIWNVEFYWVDSPDTIHIRTNEPHFIICIFLKRTWNSLTKHP